MSVGVPMGAGAGPGFGPLFADAGAGVGLGRAAPVAEERGRWVKITNPCPITKGLAVEMILENGRVRINGILNPLDRKIYKPDDDGTSVYLLRHEQVLVKIEGVLAEKGHMRAVPPKELPGNKEVLAVYINPRERGSEVGIDCNIYGYVDLRDHTIYVNSQKGVIVSKVWVLGNGDTLQPVEICDPEYKPEYRADERGCTIC